MAKDSSLAVRIAVVTALKADAALAEPLPSGRVLDGRVHVAVPETIVWPYVRYGPDDVLPYLATGIDGNDIAMMLHAFAEGATDDDAKELSARVAAALDGKVLDLTTDYPAKLADVRWTGTQVLRDIGRVDGWHGVVRFAGKVVS